MIRLLLALLLTAPLAAEPAPSIFSGYATPAPILRGIVLTESSGRPHVVGDDGLSEGAAQLNRRYHAERAYWWGDFDPYNLRDAIRITDGLFQANLRALQMAEGCIDPSTWAATRELIAIAAHRQGLWGALRDGATGWYVSRVRMLGK